MYLLFGALENRHRTELEAAHLLRMHLRLPQRPSRIQEAKRVTSCEGRRVARKRFKDSRNAPDDTIFRCSHLERSRVRYTR